MKYERIKGLVSFVISNYNNEKYITECLDSILNQTYEDIEIILVDDNSTDNSVDIVKKWILDNKDNFKKDNYIQILKLPRNVGFSGCVTSGLFLAKGEYIAMHDSDDKSHHTRIEKQVNYLLENEEINAVGSNYAVFSAKDKEPKIISNGLEYGVSKIKDVYSEGNNCVSHGTLLIKGVVFDQIGGLTRKLDGAEDYEFITKLLATGIDNIDEVLYYYRNHENQRSIEFYGTAKRKIDKTNLRVLMVLDSLNVGGTETHVLSLIKEMMSRDIYVCVLANHGGLSTEFIKLGCTVYNIDFPLRVIKDKNDAQRFNNKIKQVISTENINIVHAHQSPSGALCIDVCNAIGVPCVFTVHGLYYYDILYDKLNICKSVISVSQPAYDWLREYHIMSTVVPNAIKFEDYEIKPNYELKESLGISENSFTLVYCSRIAWDKTKVAENLLRVCRDLVRMEKLDLHLVIVGDGPDFNQISAIANRINSMLNGTYIHLVGARPNVQDYYSIADCIVGTGRVAIEAMAAKKPIIAAGNNGYYGLLDCSNIEDAWRVYFGDHKSIKSNNASFLYNDLKNVYNDKSYAVECGESCYTWAKEQFSIENSLDKILDVYENAINSL